MLIALLRIHGFWRLTAVRVHRGKLFRALDMLTDGKTLREVARETRLSFT